MSLGSLVLGALIACLGSFNAGCFNTGSRKNVAAVTSGTGTPPPGGGGVTPTTGQLTYAQVALGTSQAGQIAPGTIHALTFTLQASGTSAVAVTSMTFTSSGTVDETRFGAAVVVQDANSNGIVDAAEAAATLGSSTPGFTSNNASTTIVFTTPLAIPAGTTNQYFLLLAGGAGTGLNTVTKADAGATVVTTVSAATGILATAAGAATTAGGTFGGTQTVTLGIHDHLLISEVAFGGGAGATSTEFIEIFNPTPYVVPMQNYHLTDVSPQQFKYWDIVNGGVTPPFGPFSTATNDDFTVRFPASFSINPGQVIVVALDGNAFSAVTFTPALPAGTPVLAIRNVATGQTQMLVFPGTGNFTFTPANAQGATPVTCPTAGLTNGGEGVVLFFWDGATAPVKATVTDIDYVFYGTPNTANTRTNKSGLAINKTTTPTATGTYLTEVPGSEALLSGGTGDSVSRNNFVETGETATGSNGFNGDDEMSEPGSNWTRGSAPSPGTLP